MEVQFSPLFDHRKWQEVDHDMDESLAGSLTGPSSGEGESDPLGLGAVIECVG